MILAKTNDKKLDENKMSFENYFDTFSDIVYSYNFLTDEISYKNRMLQNYVGKAEITTIRDYQEKIIHPEDWDIYKKFINSLPDQNKASIQYRVIDVNGEIKWFWDRCRTVTDKDRRVLGAEGIISEITEEKKVELSVKKALEREKELNELKSRFISTISHEFRTPLTSIYSSAELLESNSNLWEDDKKNYYYKKMIKTVEHLRDLLDDILLINRAESGKLQLEITSVALKTFCDDIIEDFLLLNKNNIKLNYSYSCSNTFYNLDVKLLAQILRNLISNAYKYSPNGGDIQFTVSEEKSKIVFTISDNGIGISNEDQNRLFERFYRASNSDGIEGTGLGLSIVKNAVNIHKGSVKVISKLKEGSTFIVKLPKNLVIESK